MSIQPSQTHTQNHPQTYSQQQKARSPVLCCCLAAACPQQPVARHSLWCVVFNWTPIPTPQECSTPPQPLLPTSLSAISRPNLHDLHQIESRVLSQRGSHWQPATSLSDKNVRVQQRQPRIQATPLTTPFLQPPAALYLSPCSHLDACMLSSLVQI